MNEIERAKERIIETLENNDFHLIEEAFRPAGGPWDNDGDAYILTFFDANGDEVRVRID